MSFLIYTAYAVLILVSVLMVVFLVKQRLSGVLDRLDKPDSDQEYFTALEAFDTIRPSISEWNTDAMVTGMRGMNWHGKDGIYQSSDGRMPYWRIWACSTTAKKWTVAFLIRGYTGVDWGEKPGGEREGNCEAVPFELFVDTDVVIQIARNRVKQLLPSLIRLSRCDQTDLPQSYCWNIEFEIPPTDRIRILFVMDAYTGELRNIIQVKPEKELLGIDWYLD